MTYSLPLTPAQAQGLYARHETAHAFDHVMRVYRLAEHIARMEGADLAGCAHRSPFTRRGAFRARSSLGQRSFSSTGAPRRSGRVCGGSGALH